MASRQPGSSIVDPPNDSEVSSIGRSNNMLKSMRQDEVSFRERCRSVSFIGGSTVDLSH